MATNYFYVFDENALNIISDSVYAADTARLSGVVTGMAKSNLHNKIYRQSSIMAYAWGQVVADLATTDASDGNAANLVVALKALFAAATTSKNGLMSAADKLKLNGVATNANNYVHPTTAGNIHIPAGGATDYMLIYSGTAGTAAWSQQLASKSLLSAANNTAYGLTNSNADVALQRLSHKTQYLSLPMTLFYNGVVDDYIGAFWRAVENAVVGSNIVTSRGPANYDQGSSSFVGVKPIYIDEFPSTAKLEITYTYTYTTSLGSASIGLSLSHNCVFDTYQSYSASASYAALRLNLADTTVETVVTLDLSTLSALRGKGIPLYFYGKVSNHNSSSGAPSQTLSVSKIRVLTS